MVTHVWTKPETRGQAAAMAAKWTQDLIQASADPRALKAAVTALDDDSLAIAFQGMEELRQSIEIIHAYIAVVILQRAGVLP